MYQHWIKRQAYVCLRITQSQSWSWRPAALSNTLHSNDELVLQLCRSLVSSHSIPRHPEHEGQCVPGTRTEKQCCTIKIYVAHSILFLTVFCDSLRYLCSSLKITFFSIIFRQKTKALTISVQYNYLLCESKLWMNTNRCHLSVLPVESVSKCFQLSVNKSHHQRTS